MVIYGLRLTIFGRVMLHVGFRRLRSCVKYSKTEEFELSDLNYENILFWTSPLMRGLIINNYT